MAKKIGIALAGVVVLLLLVIAMQPSTYTVKRSATMAAPPNVAYALINDFHRWVDWSPWDKLDATMKKTFSGPASGAGASYEWVGNKDVGKGRMTIEAVKPNEQVSIKLEFIEPFASTSQTTFDIAPAGTGTQVTWSMTGNLGFVEKGMGLFMSWEGMIGPDFEKGLAAMKTIAEGEAKKAAEAAEAAARAAAEAAARKAAEEAAAAAAATAPAPGTAAPAKAAK